MASRHGRALFMLFEDDEKSPLLADLVAYWKFDETSGNAADSTTNGNTLTNNGTIVATTGKVNNAANLNGSSQWFSIANTPSVSMGDIDFTISGWFYIADNASLQVLLTKDYEANEYCLLISTGVLFFRVGGGGVVGNVTTTYVEGVTTGWHHITMRHDSVNNKASLKVNAHPLDEANTTGPVAASDTVLYIGKHPAGFFFNGYCDELGIWKRLLSDAEVSQLYNGGAGLSFPFDWTGQVIFEGDSLTHGDGVAANLIYPVQTMSLIGANKNGYKYGNYGSGGDTIANMVTEGATIDALFNVLYHKNIAVLWAGINDICNTPADAATVHGNLTTWIAARKLAGFNTIVLTISPANYDGMLVGAQTVIDATNVLIRSDKCGAHVLVDVAANEYLDDPNDATYFSVDKLHMNATGYAIVASMVKDAILAL